MRSPHGALRCGAGGKSLDAVLSGLSAGKELLAGLQTTKWVGGRKTMYDAVLIRIYVGCTRVSLTAQQARNHSNDQDDTY